MKTSQRKDPRHGLNGLNAVAALFRVIANALVPCPMAGRSTTLCWMTLNEILCFTGSGYGTNDKAPGLQLPDKGYATQQRTPKASAGWSAR